MRAKSTLAWRVLFVIGAVDTVLILCVWLWIAERPGTTITVPTEQDVVYATNGFHIVPNYVFRIVAISTIENELVLDTEADACTTSGGTLRTFLISHAPRGVFHVGQRITTEAMHTPPTIRIVTAAELQRMGCSR